MPPRLPAAPGPARPFRRCAHGAFIALAATLVAHTAPAAAQTPPPAPARADATAVYDIPPGPLAQALNRFAQQAGVALVMDADRVQGRSSPGLRGRHGVADGFAELLRGTGLAAARTSAGYTLVADPSGSTSAAPSPTPSPAPTPPTARAAPAPETLPAVRVIGQADGERANGPVKGYVARRSATGTRTDTPLLETPQSVTVITADQIAEQAAQSVAQTLRYAGGVTSEPRGTMTALDFFYARGFELNQYLDGMRTLTGGYSLPQPDPYLLERVEVLRGPASVLYGQADPGGVVNLVTKRPTAEARGDALLQLGNRHRVQAAFDVSGPIDEARGLSARIALIARDADTEVDHAGQRRIAIVPSIAWRPDARTSLTLLANYQDDPKVGHYNWVPAYGTVLDNPYRPGRRLPSGLDTGEPSFDRYARKTWGFTELFEHRFDDTFLVRQSLRYARVSSAFDNVYSSFLDEDFHTLNRYAWHLRDQVDAITADQHLQATFRTGPVGHTLIAGVDLQHNRYRQRLGYNFDGGTGPGQVPPLDIYDPVYGQPIDMPEFASDALQKDRQLGVYVQDQMAIGRARLLVGGRQDWVRSGTDERLSGYTERQRDHAFTARAGAVYLLDGGWAPYASYTESFRPTTGSDFAGRLFKPTEGRQYEAGVKWQPADGSALAMLSVYQLTQRNVVTSDFAHPGFSLQTGEIRSRGVEVSGALSLTNRLNLTAAASHVRQVVTRGSVDFGPTEGKRPPVLPADTASAWATWTQPVAALGALGVGLGVRYVGSSWGDNDNTFKVPSRTLMDAELHLDLAGSLSGWRVAVNATNLFDRVFVAGCGGTDYCAYGERRGLLVSLGRRW